MLLEKVIVENIRSHKYYKLEPLTKGITAINGENGAGKSTLLDSCAWALFGTRVNGQNNKDLIREGIDPKVEKVQVTVYIIVGNQKYKIKRQIMDTKGIVNCKVYSKLDNNTEWKFETGPSVKHAEKEIRKILNTDEKGFLSSVFIQQKQVDQIISAGPKERGQVIEKLIGVSAITEAISAGKEEIRALQTASNMLKVESLEEAELRVKDQGEKVKILKDNIVKLEESIKELQEKFVIIEKNFEIEKVKQDILDTLNQNLLVKKDSLIVYENQLKQQLEIIEHSKPKRGKKVSVELLEQEQRTMSLDLAKFSEELYKKKTLKDELDILYSNKLSKNKIEKEYTKKEEEHKEVLLEVDKINTDIILLKNKVKSYSNLIKLLESGSGECILCNTPFNNPEKELERHKKELEEDKIKAKDLTERKNLYERTLNVLNQDLKILKENIEIIKKQEENKEIYSNLKKNISRLSTKVANYTEEIDIINKKLTDAKAEQEKVSLLQITKNQALETEKTISLLKKEISTIEKEIDKSTAISKKDYRILENNLNEERDNLQKLKTELTNKKFEVELEKERGRTILVEYNSCKTANEEYKRIVDQINILTLSNSTLQLFKKERIKTSIPALTKIASEIFSKFTEGKFTELQLNEKFEAFVKTANQTLRPVSLLSGGELSSAAIALRLAIALFLSNEQESLLILDEVLVSMSEDRSQNILETIASLSKSQMIFIAHNVSINQFADKVVQL